MASVVSMADLFPLSLPPLFSLQFTNGDPYLALFVRIDISIWVSPEHNDISDRLANPRDYESSALRNMAAMCNMLDEQGLEEMPDSAIQALRGTGAGAEASPIVRNSLQLPSPLAKSSVSSEVGSARSLGSSSSSRFSMATLSSDVGIHREMILQEISGFQQALREHVKTSQVPLSELKARVNVSKRVIKADDAMRKRIAKNDAAFEKQRTKALQTLEKEVVKAYKNHHREVNARRSELRKMEQVGWFENRWGVKRLFVLRWLMSWRSFRSLISRHTFFVLQAKKDSSHALERLAVAREKGYQALLDAEQHFLTSLHDVHVKHLDENIHALEQRHREMFSQQLTVEVGKEHDRMRETLKKTINQKGVYHMAAVRKTTASGKSGHGTVQGLPGGLSRLVAHDPYPPFGLKLQKDREVVEMVNNRITHAAVEISAELVRHNKRMMVRVGRMVGHNRRREEETSAKSACAHSM